MTKLDEVDKMDQSTLQKYKRNTLVAVKFGLKIK